ncbi:MAG: hypothetical protein ABIR28_09220 [Vicinamibacteria bacterium]
MAQTSKRIELRQKERLFWLLLKGGPRFSATSSAELVGMAGDHFGGNPLLLGLGDSLTIKGSLLPFAPVLEALRPNVEMTSQLEKAIRNDSSVPLVHLANEVNGSAWGWFRVSHGSVGSRARWHLVPHEFGERGPAAVHLSSTRAGEVFESSLRVKGSVGLEMGAGHAPVANWAEVRYDIADANDRAREHLKRDYIGLSAPAAKPTCPYCKAIPNQDWKFAITVADPISDDFIGEAMARVLQPCGKHLRVAKPEISFQGAPYYWQPEEGMGLQVRQSAVWTRAR